MFWLAVVLFCAMAIAAIVWLTVPSDSEGANAAHGADTARRNVLVANLEELELARQNGIIDEHQFGLAKAEIARHMFALQEGADAEPVARVSRPLAFYATLAAVPAISVALYLALGQPGYDDQPLHARSLDQAPGQDSSVAELVARAELFLADNPQDARGWLVLAPVYRKQGDLERSARAYANALQYGQFEPTRRAGLMAELGEIRIAMNSGIISDNPRALLARALQLDPANVKAAYYLAIEREQAGQEKEAKTAWMGLLERVEDTNPTLAKTIRTRLAALGTSVRGPSAEDVEAAAALSADDRQVMIEGMVAQLAARLQDTPDDLPGWKRLIRSYLVLEKRDQSVTALQSARTAFQSKPQALAELTNLARNLGLEPSR